MYLQVLICTLTLLTAPSSGGAAWYDVWRSFDVDPLVAESVVWPEMERYSRMRDMMETAANYGTYITTGGGPDFSIGIFQMKPSFIEAMEKAWMSSGLARKYNLWFDTDNTVTARRIRISRLQKEEWQVIYVGVFLRLLYAAYGSVNKRGEHTQDGLETLPVHDQVRLAATAYNRGVVWAAPGYGDVSALWEHAGGKFFHYAIIPSKRTRRYCYATLALKHYKKISGRVP